MKDFPWRIKEARDQKHEIEVALKKFAAGTALIGTAVICAGFYNGDQQYVEEVYTVQEGDTLWSISQEFLPKNTGGRRYILEFQQGIIEGNEELQADNGGYIYPGQKLTISYWTKKEKTE